MIRELAALPEDSLVSEYDNDPVYSQRRLKELFVDICTADPGESWSGYERFLGQVQQRQQVQAIVKAAEWLRKNHYEGAVKDPDLNAEGVIAMVIIFAAEGGARITARTGQREFERFVKAMRDRNIEGYSVFEGDLTHYTFTPEADYVNPASVH